NLALDSGINFLDTAACYADTEELIGSTVSHRRDEFFLASKCGHAVDSSLEPWTAEVIAESVDRSLKRLRTDHLDVLQLHTPTLDVLQRGEVVEAAVKARDQGKTRFIGFSGDNEAAVTACESGVFDTLQTSFNLVDQSARGRLFAAARASDMGTIIKRPVGNGAWGRGESPYRYANEYFRRAQVMEEMGPLAGSPEDPILLAMGFLFAHDEVDTAIVGTHNPTHLTANIEMVENDLPIPAEAVEELRRRFDEVGQDWPGLT
ncbi:MAG: aldo/keto reductase, partial [Chloroflexi bacterium]|nr:aldo/keto reductase [Chloroflexota bacterium]